MKARRSQRGVTLIETMMAATLTAVTLTTGLILYISSLMGWYRGQGRIDAEESSRNAVREVAFELRQAMSVRVDGDGNGLTYYLPAKDSTGTDLVPITSDGLARRIELDGTTLNMIAGNSTRPLCTNVILTDPNSAGSSSTYQVFTAGGGANTRSITVMLVSQRKGFGTELVTSRNRESIYLRNIPQITQ